MRNLSWIVNGTIVMRASGEMLLPRPLITPCLSLVTEFVEHVSRHVTEAEVRGPGADADTEEVFGCLWSECGFESPSSEEMVRHINFHSFHTKIKCHGYNMVTGIVSRSMSECP